MKKVNIEIPHNGYEVLIGKNVFQKLPKIIKSKKLNTNLFFVIDFNVFEIYSKLLLEVMENDFEKNNFIVIEASEKLKSFATMQKIYKKLLEYDYSRDTLLVAVGGGIVGDISGFVASTFSRGIEYVQIPTTLLSTVDSSVGGKTGINFGNTKNIIGAFNQPDFVLIDTMFLESLTEEELLSGLGEIVKYAYLTDEKFYKYIKNNIDSVFERKENVFRKIILESVKFKGDVVVSDEKESGNRKMLNLGHTFAHAFEVVSKYKIKHGQAVIVGIASAIFLSERIGLISKEQSLKLLNLTSLFQDRIKISKMDVNRLIQVMQRDKKNRSGKIKFVLLQDVGHILLDVEACTEDIIYALENGMGMFR